MDGTQREQQADDSGEQSSVAWCGAKLRGEERERGRERVRDGERERERGEEKRGKDDDDVIIQRHAPVPLI